MDCDGFLHASDGCSLGGSVEGGGVHLWEV